MSKKSFKDKHVDLLIGEENKKHYVLMTHFNTFMYYHTLHSGKTFFVAIVCKLLALKNLKCQAKDCFKINGKIITKMPKKGEFVRFKNYERKIKSSFTIYPYF